MVGVVNEKQFTEQVIETMRRFGWLVSHFHPLQVRPGVWVTPVKADGKGFPDLVAVRERVLFAELKMPGRKLRPEQAVWRSKLAAAGAETHVWTPDDIDEIDRVLRPAS